MQTDEQNLSCALDNDLISGIALASDDLLPKIDAQRMIGGFAAHHELQAEGAWETSAMSAAR